MKCAIVSVIYKRTLLDPEMLSLKKCVEVFKDKRDIVLVCPEDLDISFYQSHFDYDFKFIRLEKQWFSSWHHYSWLCKWPEFYKQFEEYDYILIYQLDCWCFEDTLDYFMDLGYDYYGGPVTVGCWNDHETVGNGGLSLRKVKSFIEELEKNPLEDEERFVAEDVYFSCSPKMKNLKVCPLDIALQFAFSSDTSETFEYWFKKTNSVLPMGFHNFYKYDALEFCHKFLSLKL